MRFLILLLTIIFLSCSDDIDNPYFTVEKSPINVNYISVSNMEISISEPISILFNQRVYSPSIYENIECVSGQNRVNFSYKINRKSTGEDEIILYPINPYIPFVRYPCLIKKGIKNMYGLEMNREVMFDFKTNGDIYPQANFSEVKFKNIYPFLKSKCSICHNKNSNIDHSGFFLTNSIDESYQSVKSYIIEGNHQESLLIKKLIGIDIFGDKMPPNEQIPLYEIERISSWIYFGGNFE